MEKYSFWLWKNPVKLAGIFSPTFRSPWKYLVLRYIVLEHIWTQLNDRHAIVLSSWTIMDQDEIMGQEVMALSDQDGFIPGQIYYRRLPKQRNKHGEFITGNNVSNTGTYLFYQFIASQFLEWYIILTTCEVVWYIISFGICLSVCVYVSIRDLRIGFLHLNRISNRIGRPIRFRIEFSNWIGRIYHAYTIGIYFVFVTNESDARNWVLVIHFNSILKRVKLCRCTII